MNDRYSAEAGVRKHVIALGTRFIVQWSRSMAVVLILTLMSLTTLPPGSALAEVQGAGTDSSEGTGIQVGSWLLSIPYCAGKSAFAIAGGTVGVLGYLFSGGNSETAQSVWITSIYGTYILRPAHLRGEEPIYFFGKADDGQDELVHHPVKRPAVTPQPPKK